MNWTNQKLRNSFVRVLAAVFALAAFALETLAQEQPKISEAEFKKLMKDIDSPTDKPWRQIPWKISLLDAQKEAAQSKKPIFIWAMDGHPLGCT